VIYNATCPMRVPWAVMPVCAYGFGSAFAAPAIGVILLEMFPHVRGLTSSLQTFFFMMVFSTLSGVISPLLFSSGLKLALGLAAALSLSGVIWWLGTIGGAEPVPEAGLSFEEE
jgi:DHA1 family bicyclomycin/chloramphenicol resistance-like MFS transporter